VRGILEQTVLPKEVCIVDSSEAARSRDVIEALCDGAGVSLRYVHPAPRGSSVQRNIGIDTTQGDPVVFVDDDVLLAPDCHGHLLEELERGGPAVGGVCATPTEPARHQSQLSVLWHIVFGLGGCDRDNHASMSPGFWCEEVCDPTDVVTLEAVRGLCMAFRREVFKEERFDENLPGYAMKEDVDLGYRLSRRHTLVQTPRARCEHLLSPRNRPPARLLMRVYVANHIYLHRKNMPQDLRHRIALWWGFVGQFFLLIARAVREREPGLVTGFVVGLTDQLQGKGLFDLETGEHVLPS